MRQIDDWLNFVVKSKVKELDLHVKKYCLPEFVLDASSLTLLKLTSLELVAPSLSSLPSLKVLSLMDVNSDAKSLQNLISGCPIIEELQLTTYSLGPIEFSVSGTLKNLSLFGDLNYEWLDDLVSGLPLLERFTISVEAPNLLEANLSVQNHAGVVTASYMDLVHLLSNLNFLKKMMLTVSVEEVLVCLKSIREKYPPLLPNLEHLKVKIHDSRLYKTEELRDLLLWCAPSLKTLETKNGCKF